MHFRQFVQQSDSLGESVWSLLYDTANQMLMGGSSVIDRGKQTSKESKGGTVVKMIKCPLFCPLFTLNLLANNSQDLIHLIFN